MTNQVKLLQRFQYWRASVQAVATPQIETTTDTTSELYITNTQLVGVAHELVAVADITDDAMMIVENLHATAVVKIGGDETGTFIPWIVIPPGGPSAVLPRAASLASVYLISDIAATPIRVTLVRIAS